MMIEPLFSEFLDSLETEKALLLSKPQSNENKFIEQLNEESVSTKLDCVTCDTSNMKKNIAVDIDKSFAVDIDKPINSVVSSVCTECALYGLTTDRVRTESLIGRLL